MSIWYKREAIERATLDTSRVRFVYSGNSNSAFGGHGHDYGMQYGLSLVRSMWATGLVNARHFEGDNQGYKWAVALHPSLNLPQDASPPSVFTDRQPGGSKRNKQIGYTYFADATTSDWTVAYHSIGLEVDCPIDVNANLRLHVYHGEFAAGTLGAMYPAWRNNAGSPRNELAVINTVTGVDQWTKSTRDIAAAARNYAMQIGWKCPGFTANVHNGPIFVDNQCVENIDRTAGWSWQLRTSWGGQSLRVLVNEWLTLTYAQQRHLLAQDRDIDTSACMVYVMHEGLNQRADATTSLGPNPTASNTRAGYLDNLNAYFDSIEDVYDTEGWSKERLFFVCFVDHPISTPDDTQLVEYRGACRDCCDARARTASFDVSQAITHAELFANTWYSTGGTDTAHLVQAAYEAIGQRAMAEFSLPIITASRRSRSRSRTAA